ncbi:ABC transporter permease, partial [Aliarcobacter butzleri]|nr:ABC transporter permease [Aliarcobacter butzleri]
MKNSVFFNFIFLLLVKHKSKYFAIFLISIFIVFLTSSILFIKNSLQKEISEALENQSDFIIQKTVANKIKDIDSSLIDEFYEINGVSKVTQRVYGQYYFMPENVYFTIIGIDFFEETTNQDLKELLNFLNISKFLEKDSMIIGNGVKKVLDKYAYFDSYDFKLENENSKNIK